MCILRCIQCDFFFKPNCLPVVAIYTIAFEQQVLLSQTESHSETLHITGEKRWLFLPRP